MLIRSQNKDVVVSIKTVNALGVERMSNDIPCMCNINAEYDGGHVELGLYESKERAKEVLEEIVGCYSIHKAVEAGKKVSIEELQRYQGMMFGCFDMPAE